MTHGIVFLGIKFRELPLLLAQGRLELWVKLNGEGEQLCRVAEWVKVEERLGTG